uniref:ATP synthase F0 subunit 8 n=1 Tax=Sphecodes ephippius TaxID=1126396 RepID=A0A0S2LS71_9HYME|nr:ATP synthase F0 subunit 8 [Sphecodes ephippius]
MPQMSPMYWILLFIWMLLYSYMFISMMFFITNYNLFTSSKIIYKKINIKFN